jgi:toxin YoeB
MRLVFYDQAWIDYDYWQETDKKILKKINTLIKDIQRNGYEGIGHPEPLKHQYSGFWSRKINDEHRLIYQIKDGELIIAQCRFHY